MNRGFLAVLVTGAAFLALAGPAAAFDHHFTVISKQTYSHQTKNGFRFKDELRAPFDRSVRVGRDKVNCTQRGRTSRCKAVLHLNGKLGGYGKIRVKGGFGPHDNRLNVTGGTSDFNGVAGKVTIRGRHGNRIHLDLVR